MTERDLVPIETVELPMLSLEQLQELADAARLYCRRRKIPIANRDIYTGAIAVLGFAVARSLQEQGRVAVLEGEPLDPLIQRGLQIRKGIYEQAELALRLVNPLALPDELVDQASREIRKFTLTANPQACEELIVLYQQRTGFLAELVQAGLANLPPELQGVGLDRFPDLADRAKLVRNMMTSYIFRGNLNPLVTNDDLKEIADTAKAGACFTNDQLESLIELLGQDKTEFLRLIFAQTAAMFQSSYSLPQEGDAWSTDRFYRSFSNFLLLQHPALEEAQIVTHQDLIQAGWPSLWDGASLIREVLIPTPEMLIRAGRQEEARLTRTTFYLNPPESLSRLADGLRAWKTYQQDLSRHNKEIADLEAELKGQGRLLANLQSDPNLSLPKRAYEIIYTSQSDARATLSKTRWYVKTVQDRRQELALEYAVAMAYRDELMQKYGQDWPDQLAMPEAVVLQREEVTKNSLAAKVANRTARLTLIATLLNADVLFQPEHEGILIKLRPPKAKEWLEQEVTNTETLLHHSAYLPYKPDWFLRNIRDRLQYGIGDLGFPKERAVIPQALRDYGAFWKDVYIGVLYDKTKASVDYWQERWHQFIRSVLEQRMSLLKTAQATLLDQADLQTQLASLKQQMAIEGREATFWSVQEAGKYIRLATASKLVLMPEPVPKNWVAEANRVMDLLLQLKSWEDLPITDHPLCPTEFTDLPRADFITAWRKRCQQVLLSEELARAQSDFAAARKKFEDVCRSTFMIRLMEIIGNLRSRLELVKQKDPEASFIHQMRNLNLVLEEKSKEHVE